MPRQRTTCEWCGHKSPTYRGLTIHKVHCKQRPGESLNGAQDPEAQRHEKRKDSPRNILKRQNELNQALVQLIQIKYPKYIQTTEDTLHELLNLIDDVRGSVNG